MSSVRKAPRPPNAFILFRSALCQSWREEEKKTLEHRKGKVDAKKEKEGNKKNLGAKSKRAGLLWAAASEKEKEFWLELAKEVELAHKNKFPDYKYMPQKKEAKERLRLEQKAQNEAKRLARNTHRVGQGRGAEGGAGKARDVSSDTPYTVPSRVKRAGKAMSTTSYAPSSATSSMVSSTALGPYPAVFNTTDNIYSLLHPASAPLFKAIPSTFPPPVPTSVPNQVELMGTPPAPPQESMMDLFVDKSDVSTASYTQTTGVVHKNYHPVTEPVFAKFDAATLSTQLIGNPQIIRANRPSEILATPAPPPQTESFLDLLRNDSDVINSPAHPTAEQEVVHENPQVYQGTAIDPALTNFGVATVAAQPAGHMQVIKGNQQSQINATPLADQFQLDVVPEFPVIQTNRLSEVLFAMDDISDFALFDADWVCHEDFESSAESASFARFSKAG